MQRPDRELPCAMSEPQDVYVPSINQSTRRLPGRGHVPDRSTHTVEEDPFLPYADLQEVPSDLKKQLDAYSDRMGFLPNALKFYSHRPHILKQIIRLNNTIMRHSRNLLSEEFKYRMSFIVSRNHGCRYCCAHHASTLRTKFGCSDDELSDILNLENPRDDRERIAWEFVDVASLGPEHVDDAHRSRLADAFSPEEVVEIVCTLGFWAFYNRVHACTAMPIETQLLGDSGWVDQARREREQ